MSESTFDAEMFLSQSVDGGMSTQVEPCPIGEYTAFIEDLEVKQFQGKKDPSKVFTTMKVKWAIDDQGVKDTLGRDKVTVPQDIFLDMTANGLDHSRGRNVTLGRLREALGQNQGTWMLSMLKGGVAKVKVEHEIVNNEPFARVTGVAKL